MQQAGWAPVQSQTILPLYLLLQTGRRLRREQGRMEKLFVLVLSLTLLTDFAGSSLILTEKQAKQLLRSRRQDRPSKPGFPDEPMREYMHHLLRLEHRAEEQFLEHWLNPHCKPHCDRNVVHPM
uniref:Chromosome 17 open reading frame 67 n=2 Tax=Canis lupus familiaris TaxID=9615 RepID=A0A8I3P1Q9_CANLF